VGASLPSLHTDPACQTSQEENRTFEGEIVMTGRFALGVLAYVVPTFLLGFTWHLVLFDGYYKALEIYRAELLVPLGLGAMVIQAFAFALIYEKVFASSRFEAGRVVRFGLVGAALSWSFTTLAVGAKNIMSSVPDYLLIETAFTLVQWAIVAPAMALALRVPTMSGQASKSASG
jgi:hypothetical protein